MLFHGPAPRAIVTFEKLHRLLCKQRTPKAKTARVQVSGNVHVRISVKKQSKRLFVWLACETARALSTVQTKPPREEDLQTALYQVGRSSNESVFTPTRHPSSRASNHHHTHTHTRARVVALPSSRRSPQQQSPPSGVSPSSRRAASSHKEEISLPLSFLPRRPSPERLGRGPLHSPARHRDYRDYRRRPRQFPPEKWVSPFC